MSKSANLIFMVMFAGGMFGVLRATGAIDASVDRLLYLTSGNVYLLRTGLMLLLACGSTFLGFMSEYLVIIPLVLGLGQRLKLPNLFAPTVIVVGAGAGYASSVTNPIALAVAQPLAGVQRESDRRWHGALKSIFAGHMFTNNLEMDILSRWQSVPWNSNTCSNN
jgi:uncharacterized ion transporter superfamily protein YfcC